jgi:hypothetical protein
VNALIAVDDLGYPEIDGQAGYGQGIVRSQPFVPRKKSNSIAEGCLCCFIQVFMEAHSYPVRWCFGYGALDLEILADKKLQKSLSLNGKIEGRPDDELLIVHIPAEIFGYGCWPLFAAFGGYTHDAKKWPERDDDAGGIAAKSQSSSITGEPAKKFLGMPY